MPPMYQDKARQHALGHRMVDGLFVRDTCAYCGLLTVDFCPECGIFVCRQCDIPKHWPSVGIFPDVGFGLPGPRAWPRPRPFRKL
jgi:hypothetical protein